MSTTEYKIKVMRAWLENKQIEFSLDDASYEDIDLPMWNWASTDYRIKQISYFTNKLFLNAPIMQIRASTSYNKNPKWELENFRYKNASEAYDVELIKTEQIQGYWDYTRLPTIEESPVNTWLVPWHEQPKELKELSFLANYGSDTISYYAPNCAIGPKWTSVKAIMILEEL